MAATAPPGLSTPGLGHLPATCHPLAVRHPTSSRVPVDGPGPQRAHLLPHTSLWTRVYEPSLQERGLDLPREVDRAHGLSITCPSTTCLSAMVHTVAFCPCDRHVQPCVGLTCAWVHVEPQACFAGAGWLAPGLSTQLVSSWKAGSGCCRETSVLVPTQGRPPWGCRSEAVPASCCLVKGGVWGTKAAGNFCDSDKSEDRTVGGVLTWCYNI